MLSVPDAPPPDRGSHSSDFQIEWLTLVAVLTGLAIMGLSFLLFGPAGVTASIGFFLLCGILWGIVTSGDF